MITVWSVLAFLRILYSDWMISFFFLLQSDVVELVEWVCVHINQNVTLDYKLFDVGHVPLLIILFFDSFYKNSKMADIKTTHFNFFIGRFRRLPEKTGRRFIKNNPFVLLFQKFFEFRNFFESFLKFFFHFFAVFWIWAWRILIGRLIWRIRLNERNSRWLDWFFW